MTALLISIPAAIIGLTIALGIPMYALFSEPKESF